MQAISLVRLPLFQLQGDAVWNRLNASYSVSGTHSCTSVDSSNTTLDIRDEMTNEAINRASDLSLSAERIWRDVQLEMQTKYASSSTALIMLRRQQLKNIVRTARRDVDSTDVYMKIKMKDQMQKRENGGRNFLKYFFEYQLFEGKLTDMDKTFRMPFWSHPNLLPMLPTRGVALYIDATFRCVPQPFRQCLIVMLLDDETEIHIPVAFILMGNISQWSYWHALHLLVASGAKIQPSTFTVDFERALLLACKEQFPKSTIIGCLFHFKQALRRKMVKLGMPADEVAKAMKHGALDSLTVTVSDGIEDAISAIKVDIGGENRALWGDFFSYFRATLMKSYDFNTWNISEAKRANVEIRNRTNNALKSFNCTINEEFTQHTRTSITLSTSSPA